MSRRRGSSVSIARSAHIKIGMSSATKNGSLITITLSVSIGMLSIDPTENAAEPNDDIVNRSRANETQLAAAIAAKHALASLNRTTFAGKAG